VRPPSAFTGAASDLVGATASFTGVASSAFTTSGLVDAFACSTFTASGLVVAVASNLTGVASSTFTASGLVVAVASNLTGATASASVTTFTGATTSTFTRRRSFSLQPAPQHSTGAAASTFERRRNTDRRLNLEPPQPAPPQPPSRSFSLHRAAATPSGASTSSRLCTGAAASVFTGCASLDSAPRPRPSQRRDTHRVQRLGLHRCSSFGLRNGLRDLVAGAASAFAGTLRHRASPSLSSRDHRTPRR
jgi:hypothetical protein